MGNWKEEAAGMTQYCEVLILSGNLALLEYFFSLSLWEHNANPAWSFYSTEGGNSSLQQEPWDHKGKSKAIPRRNKMLKQACALELKVGLRWQMITASESSLATYGSKIDVSKRSETRAWQLQKWMDCARLSLTALAKMPCCLLKYNLTAVREQATWPNAYWINSSWFSR